MHCLPEISEDCSKSGETSVVDSAGRVSKSGRKMATHYENCDTAYGSFIRNEEIYTISHLVKWKN